MVSCVIENSLFLVDFGKVAKQMRGNQGGKRASTAIDRLSIVWMSDLSDKIKRDISSKQAVVAITLQGCIRWTLTKRVEKKLDGNCTRMCSYIEQQLYGHLPPVSKTIQVRRTRHVGHCWRSKGELISDVFLWTPTHGRVGVSQPARIYYISFV